MNEETPEHRHAIPPDVKQGLCFEVALEGVLEMEALSITGELHDGFGNLVRVRWSGLQQDKDTWEDAPQFVRETTAAEDEAGGATQTKTLKRNYGYLLLLKRNYGYLVFLIGCFFFPPPSGSCVHKKDTREQLNVRQEIVREMTTTSILSLKPAHCPPLEAYVIVSSSLSGARSTLRP